MPVSVTVDTAARLVRGTGSGRLNKAEIVEALHRMVNDPAFEPALPQLLDLREVIGIDASSDEIRAIAREGAALAARLGHGKCAIVANLPVVYGLSRMYEVFTEDHPVQVRTFRDYDEAVRWLGVSGEYALVSD